MARGRSSDRRRHPKLQEAGQDAHFPAPDPRRLRTRRRVRGPHRRGRDDRAQGLDAGAVPPAARPDDVAARPFGDRRHAARGQLDHPRALACAARCACSPRCRTKRATGSTSTAAPRRWASTAHELIDQLLNGKAKYSSIFNYPTLTWADIGVHRLVRRRRGDREPDVLAKASYGPYARAMVRICKEENFHKRQGYEIVATLAAGTPAQRAMVQDAVNRWWWPSLMMFGPQRRQLAEQRGAAPLAGEAEEQRRAAPALRGSDRGAGEGGRSSRCPIPSSATTRRPRTGSSARSTGTEF